MRHYNPCEICPIKECASGLSVGGVAKRGAALRLGRGYRLFSFNSCHGIRIRKKPDEPVTGTVTVFVTGVGGRFVASVRQGPAGEAANSRYCVRLMPPIQVTLLTAPVRHSA